MAIVLVYSDDPVTREQVRTAIGHSPSAEVPEVTFLMTETAGEVTRAVDEGVPDLLVLDGEAWPAGGMGVCRELKHSAAPCPPVLVLIGRHDDRWLAKWSQADAVATHPIDAYQLSRTVVDLMTAARVPTEAATRGPA